MTCKIPTELCHCTNYVLLIVQLLNPNAKLLYLYEYHSPLSCMQNQTGGEDDFFPPFFWVIFSLGSSNSSPFSYTTSYVTEQREAHGRRYKL